MSLVLKRKAISVEAYHLMIEAGILTEEDKVELLHGDIVKMSPVGSRHAAHVKLLRKLLGAKYNDKALIGVQDPVQLDEFSQPEPDISVLHPDKGFFLENHPSPDEVFFLIEIADSTLELDRTVKAPMYAKAGIGEYWILNLPEQKVEVYTQPSGGIFKHVDIYTAGDMIQLMGLSEVVAVDEILL